MKQFLLKIEALLLCLALLFVIVGCENPAGQDPESGDPVVSDPAGERQIKNVIIIIGDGMGLPHIAAGQLAYGTSYDFASWPFVTVNTNSIDDYSEATVTTDSAASATALATGMLTINGYVGKDMDGNSLETILDLAAALGKSTGIVTTDTLAGATPSGFSAHALNRNDEEAIVTSQLASGVTLLCGQSDSAYTSRGLLIQNGGYKLCTSLETMEKNMDKEKLLLMFQFENGKDSSIDLKDATKKSLEYLSKDPEGFVLMIEQAHIDKSSHSNDFGGITRRMKSLNETVEAVMEFAKGRTDTVVLVTADHETGGLSVSSNVDMYQRRFETTTGEKISYDFSSLDHTNSLVGLFYWGIDLDFTSCEFYRSDHMIKNSDIFFIMKNLLDLKVPAQ